MMVLNHVGDQEASHMVYAQLGQQPLVRTTETSPEPGRGTLSCLSARPPDQMVANMVDDHHEGVLHAACSR